MLLRSSGISGARSHRIAVSAVVAVAACLAIFSAVPARAADGTLTGGGATLFTVGMLNRDSLADAFWAKTEANVLGLSSPTLLDPSQVAASAVQESALDSALHPVTFALRLGALASPRWKFAGGADFTFNKVRLAPNLQTRIDADAIVSANFGGASTIVPVTLDEIYSHGLVHNSRVYFGGGVGPYFGNVTRFGAKVLVGGDFTSHLGAEIGVHFSGSGDALLTAQLRTPF